MNEKGGSGTANSTRVCLLVLVGAVCLAAWRVDADQVDMQNGDHYTGKVLALNSERLTLQNDVLGTLQLPRNKIKLISFGPVPATNQVAPGTRTNALEVASAHPPTNATPAISPAMRQLAGSSNLVGHVEAQLLKDAPPEAREKFNELLSGLLSGKLTVSDIRAQAQTAADQVRAMRKDLGEEGAMVDGYLAILDKFLKETSDLTNSAVTRVPKATPPAGED